MRSFVRSLVIVGLVASCMVSLLTTFVTSASAVTKHGCASPTPTTVSGPLYQPSATQGSLFMNEVLLTPHSNWNCSELGVYTPTSDTWVELYNPQNEPLDLYAVHTSIDSGPNTNAFYLPFGSAIAAHSYFVVFPRTSPSFVSTESSTWRLLISGLPVDEVKLPALGEDQSYARIPDGSSTWEISNAPTINASNALPLATPTKTTRGSTVGVGTGAGTTTGTGTYTGTGGILPGQGGQQSGTGSQSQQVDGQQVDGQQPSWNKLATSKPVSMTPLNSPSTSFSSPLVAQSATDIPRKILLTILVVALALALVWCWRIFMHSSQKPSDMVSSTETEESQGRA